MVSEQQQQILEAIMGDEAEAIPVKYRNRMLKVRFIRNGTLRKITEILNGQDPDRMEGHCEDTIPYKLAAAYLLNSWWGLRFLGGLRWALLWRRLQSEISWEDCKAICDVCKKKVPLKAYLEIMTSQLALRDTLQQMTREEIEAVLQEHRSEQADR
jgi:hypothetical protein